MSICILYNIEKERGREIAYLQAIMCIWPNTYIKYNLIGLNRMWFSIYSPPVCAHVCVCASLFFAAHKFFSPLFNFTLICIFCSSVFHSSSSYFFIIEKLNVCTIFLTRIKTVCCLKVDLLFMFCNLWAILSTWRVISSDVGLYFFFAWRNMVYTTTVWKVVNES